MSKKKAKDGLMHLFNAGVLSFYDYYYISLAFFSRFEVFIDWKAVQTILFKIEPADKKIFKFLSKKYECKQGNYCRSYCQKK